MALPRPLKASRGAVKMWHSRPRLWPRLAGASAAIQDSLIGAASRGIPDRQRPPTPHMAAAEAAAPHQAGPPRSSAAMVRDRYRAGALSLTHKSFSEEPTRAEIQSTEGASEQSPGRSAAQPWVTPERSTEPCRGDRGEQPPILAAPLGLGLISHSTQGSAPWGRSALGFVLFGPSGLGMRPARVIRDLWVGESAGTRGSGLLAPM